MGELVPEVGEQGLQASPTPKGYSSIMQGLPNSLQPNSAGDEATLQGDLHTAEVHTLCGPLTLS